jgi:dTDP-4-dehydrorhamnose reductase
MLGTDLMGLLAKSGTEVLAVDLEELDITEADAVSEFLARYRPGLVINAAAFTDVDACETMQEAAFSVNAQGTANLANACKDVSAVLMHISTDYVFDGRNRQPYDEEEAMSPLGVYGRSKAEGEKRVRMILPDNHCIVRTEWLYGTKGKNFVDAILRQVETKDRLTVVDDQTGSPTYTVDLAAALLKIADKGGLGTFHVTNSGETTWHGFACKILEMAEISGVRVEPIKSRDLERPAPRPGYSILSNARFTELTGERLRDWEQALGAYLAERRSQGDRSR